jgi:Tfp pilus assembly protein PilN
MTSAPNQLSFLPDDYLDLKAQRRTNAVCASLFACVALTVGAAFFLTERMVKHTESDYAEVLRTYAEAAQPIQQFRTMQDQQKRMELQAALSGSLLEKVPRSYLLAEITNALPGNVSLWEFALDSKLRNEASAPRQYKTIYEQKKAEIDAAKIAGDKANEPRVYDVSMKLTGVADNDQEVAAFINALTRSSLLKDVNLVVSDEFQPSPTDGKLRKFQIEMTLNPEADVKAPSPGLNKVINSQASVK